MSFDKPTRNALTKMVTACRNRLYEDITDQLQGIYGLHPDGTVLPVSSLIHLTDLGKGTANTLRGLLEHTAESEAGTEINSRIAAYQRIVREIGFTILNRLAALKMCEERGLVIECVRKGMSSDGYKLFDRLTGGALGTRYQTYRVFLENLFDELAIDLGLLFYRTTPHASIFPTERCLEDILEILNDEGLSHLWREDETIGWIYQDYNEKKERKEMREAPAPRDSRELAVRNQFFTPRYVVEFLTDNTLGRIWYEMMQGETTLKEECHYIVHQSNEIFLGPGENAPEEFKNYNNEVFSPEEIIKHPVYIPYRSKKDPRDIQILDPACGSGHFLLYCFDLLIKIYEEAWADANAASFSGTGKRLCEDYQDLNVLRQKIPGLILRHNLHGIDIDPRACQIASLSLWLRAQRSYQGMGIKSASRPRITRTNIVCAEPMPGNKEMLEEFIEGLRPRVLGQLVQVIFDKIKMAGEAGYLLKIEEEIADIVKEARKKYLEEYEIATDERGNNLLFSKSEIRKSSSIPQLELDFSDLTEEEFWEEADDRIVDALQDYAYHSTNGRFLSRRLFVDDVVQGFAFVDMCRNRFDVVLMNPPFGKASLQTSDYLEQFYPEWNQNLLCAFIKRAWEISSPAGVVGVILDRTALVKSTYENFRRNVIVPDNRISALADLGWGVLDADVEVTALVIGHTLTNKGIFVDARNIAVNEKGDYVEVNINRYVEGVIDADVVVEIPSMFRRLPNAVIGYDFPEFLRVAFDRASSVEEVGYKANVGHQFKAEKHFRLWWEVGLPNSIQFIARMFNGAGFSPYSTVLHDCVIAATKLESLPKDTATVLRNREAQMLPGICFGKRGEYFCTHILPSGHIFTVEGQSIPIADEGLALELLGFFNTPLVRMSLNKYCGQHKYSGYVNLLPYRQFKDRAGTRDQVSLVLDAYLKARQFDETQSFFSVLFYGESIDIYAEKMLSSIKNAWSLSAECEHFCHLESMKAYQVSEEERVLIESFKERQPAIETPIEDADINGQCKWIGSHGIISHAVGCVYGRWDVRVGLNPSLAAKLPGYFEPLPFCSPGMLVNPAGLPATPGNIVSEEWLRAKPDAINLPPDGSVKMSIISDEEYPLKITWDGILVDDAGNRKDLVQGVREVLNVVYGEKSGAIEHEACEIFGVRKLRDYFRKPSGFFQDHLKRYTKSRRPAPIYWPFSTPSGSYTIWIYYHKLTSDTLYTAVNQYVNPKIADVERQISKMESRLAGISGRDATTVREHLNDLKAFLSELNDFKAELLRVAGLPYKPDLNDGVIINAAPLYKLFKLAKWARDTRVCWEKLERGEHDWSHMAYHICPDRVREVCKKDLSIAIAHDMETLYQNKKISKGRKKSAGKK